MCNCNSCCGNYAESGYWRDKQIKEYEDKIEELKAELAKSQESVAMWRGSCAENSYWRGMQIKEYEDKIEELETELSKTQTGLLTWRQKALYQAPVFRPDEPVKPIKPETTFIDILFILLAFVFPWVMIVGSFLFGWNGILR